MPDVFTIQDTNIITVFIYNINTLFYTSFLYFSSPIIRFDKQGRKLILASL